MLRTICSLLVLLIFIQLNISCSAASDDSNDGMTNVLIISNEEAGNMWIDTSYTKYMSGIEFSYINVDDSLPNISDFEGFDVVLLYEDGSIGNGSEIGNLLYSYVMAGGNLVLGTFYWQGRTDGGYSGSWGNLEMIDPLFYGSCDYAYDSLGSVSNHDLTQGVTSLKTYYRGGADSLRNNATAVAWWNDGDVLVAYNKPNGTITAVTTAPHEGYYWDSRQFPNEPEGDFFRLWENALKWTGRQGSGFSKEAANRYISNSLKKDETKKHTEMDISRPSGGKYIIK